MDSDAEPQAEPSRRLPTIQFRVLIIGRANAGKTSILQRVCETTESPVIRRVKEEKSEEILVRCAIFFVRMADLTAE